MRQVLTVSSCRARPMTPEQVEVQTEQVQFEEPALSAEQISANQAGTFINCCCCAACACRHSVAHGGQAPVHMHAMGGIMQGLRTGLHQKRSLFLTTCWLAVSTCFMPP